MKRLFLSVLFAVLLCTVISASASAKDYSLNEDNTYTVEIPGKTAGKDYTIVVVAGDYTNKDMPEISEVNIIYIDQVTADDNGVVAFTAFIPMTDSVGTIYIGGDEVPETEGLLMTESGLGYIAGRLISYSGKETTVIIPDSITTVDSDAIEASDNVENVVVKNGSTEFSANAISAGTKLFISPVANAAKTYAVNNGLAYAYLGDTNRDDSVDIYDYLQLLGIYSEGKTVTEEELSIILDLDFNGDVNFRDLSVLLQFVGGTINDYYRAFSADAN